MNGKHFRSTWPVFHFSVASPHPARAAPGPPSPEGKASSRRGLYTLSLREGGRAEGPDGCGAERRTDLVPPLFRRCGGTFPQGKVRKRLRRGIHTLSKQERASPPVPFGTGGADLSSRNPGFFLPGWGAAASGWPCFRSGGSALSSRRRSGPPLPGCGSGRRTYRSASAARRLPAR